MPNVGISLNANTVSTDVLHVPQSGRFIALDLDGTRIYLHGYDAAAVQSARQIIDALQLAIVQLEAAAEQAAV